VFDVCVPGKPFENLICEKFDKNQSITLP